MQNLLELKLMYLFTNTIEGFKVFKIKVKLSLVLIKINVMKMEVNG
jgi:hypothetical protein